MFNAVLYLAYVPELYPYAKAAMQVGKNPAGSTMILTGAVGLDIIKQKVHAASLSEILNKMEPIFTCGNDMTLELAKFQTDHDPIVTRYLLGVMADLGSMIIFKGRALEQVVINSSIVEYDPHSASDSILKFCPECVIFNASSPSTADVNSSSHSLIGSAHTTHLHMLLVPALLFLTWQAALW
jgi:hypothetical protein